MSAARQIMMAPEIDPKLLISQIESLLNHLKSSVDERGFKALESEMPITKTEAAEHLRITYKVFERRLSEGHYPASLIHRDGGTMLFFKSELTKYIKSVASNITCRESKERLKPQYDDTTRINRRTKKH